jgi:uridine kinase
VHTSASSSRSNILGQIASSLLAIPFSHPLRVAIDGIDAAGKTELAGELEELLQENNRTVIRASIDGFHHPRAERYQRGFDSPEGYYLDSFDIPAVVAALLQPLSPGGDRRYRCAVFDHRRDSPVREEWRVSPQDAILLFDGIFSLRPELTPYWDYRIFIQIAFETSVERGCRRDLRSGSQIDLQDLRKRYWRRYVAGQKIYLQTVQPEILADIILENDDVDHPRLLFKH